MLRDSKICFSMSFSHKNKSLNHKKNKSLNHKKDKSLNHKNCMALQILFNNKS